MIGDSVGWVAEDICEKVLHALSPFSHVVRLLHESCGNKAMAEDDSTLALIAALLTRRSQSQSRSQPRAGDSKCTVGDSQCPTNTLTAPPLSLARAIVALAALCFHAHVWHSFNAARSASAMPRPRILAPLGAGAKQLHASSVCKVIPHLIYICFVSFSTTPGTVLSALLWDGVLMIEKEDNCQRREVAAAAKAVAGISASSGALFDLPCAILKLLIHGVLSLEDSNDCAKYFSLLQSGSKHSQTFMSWYHDHRPCVHRVSKMYERLLIDLDHAGRGAEALAEAQMALLDVAVLVSASQCSFFIVCCSGSFIIISSVEINTQKWSKDVSN